jgi:hypothetical protein
MSTLDGTVARSENEIIPLRLAFPLAGTDGVSKPVDRLILEKIVFNCTLLCPRVTTLAVPTK